METQILTEPHAVESHWAKLGPAKFKTRYRKELLASARNQNKLGSIVSYDGRTEDILLPIATLGYEHRHAQWGTLYQQGILVLSGKPVHIPLLRQKANTWETLPCSHSHTTKSGNVPINSYEKDWLALKNWSGSPGIFGKSISLTWSQPSVTTTLNVPRDLTHTYGNEINLPGMLIARNRIRDLEWTTLLTHEHHTWPNSNPLTALINDYLAAQPWQTDAQWETRTLYAIAEQFPMAQNPIPADTTRTSIPAPFPECPWLHGLATTTAAWNSDRTNVQAMTANWNTALLTLLHPGTRYLNYPYPSDLDLLGFLIRMPEEDIYLSWNELRLKTLPHSHHTKMLTENYRWVPFIKSLLGFDPDTITPKDLTTWLANPPPEWAQRRPYLEALTAGL